MPDNKGQPTWGPNHPHPLAKMSTELVWDGKYDEYGNRREVDIAGCAYPWQPIETVDQPRSEAAAKGEQHLTNFDHQTKRMDDFRNRLIWGDNKLVMASLLAEFKGKVDLIYIDPPFDVGADFTMDVPIGDEKETVAKDQSALEMVAFRDMWGKGTDSYLHMMYERLVLMGDLLSEGGSVYVHCDWRVAHYLRLILDGILGQECYRNEIVWHHQVIGTPRTNPSRFAKAHETLLWYSRTPTRFVLNSKDQLVRVPWSEDTRKSMKQDEDGRWYYERRRTGTNNPWAHDPRFLRTYVDDPDAGKTASDVWDDLPSYQPVPAEKTGYNTQKPEGLVERVVAASSGFGDLVADFFCGSGTTGAVAERLGRRWIMCDLGRFAIHTSRKRLIELQRTLHTQGKPYRAFDVYNLGRYERQWWQKERLHNADAEHRRIVLEFFKAEVLTNTSSPLLHGRKAGAFCHVDGIDSVFGRDEAKSVARAAVAAGGRECYCLAWEFEMDLGLTTAALEQELGVKLKLIQIPREIMEKNRKSPPPFLEVAVLAAEPVYRKEGGKRRVDIKLTRFIPSLAEVPSAELEVIKARALRSEFDFIDFWAVDFEWRSGRPFNHHWQDYRTRKDRSLKTVSEAGHIYPKPCNYTACVKVVDIFGCDTSITVEVKV